MRSLENDLVEITESSRNPSPKWWKNLAYHILSLIKVLVITPARYQLNHFDCGKEHIARTRVRSNKKISSLNTKENILVAYTISHQIWTDEEIGKRLL